MVIACAHDCPGYPDQFGQSMQFSGQIVIVLLFFMQMNAQLLYSGSKKTITNCFKNIYIYVTNLFSFFSEFGTTINSGSIF